MAPTCSTPLYDMLINDTMNWLVCSHGVYAGGVLVVGTFMYAVFAFILLNWTESFYPPLAWTALSSGVIFTLLPGDLLMRVVGLVTIGVTFAIITLWQTWRH